LTPAAVNEEIKLLQSFSGENQDACVLKSIKHVSGNLKNKEILYFLKLLFHSYFRC
jgi:hypothetical protein